MIARFSTLAGVATLAAVLGLLSPAARAPVARAAAPPPAPLELQVYGTQGEWRWARQFALTWTIPNHDGGPFASAHYRLRDPSGDIVVGPAHVPGDQTAVQGLAVPGPPGTYEAEVWFEAADGQRGPAARVPLRFDDVRPEDVRPFVAANWLGRTDFPLPIRISRPLGAPPLSGIRGYAVSLTQLPVLRPCASTVACTEAETDLREGAEGDVHLVPHLPEGTTYVQALAVSGSGRASARAGEAVLRVDTTSPAVRLLGLPSGWTNRPVNLTAVASDTGSGMADGPGGVPPFTAISLDDGRPIVAAGATVGVTVIGEGVHRVAYYARDLAGNVDDGASGNGNPNPPPREAVVRIDRTPPQVAFASQDPGDPGLLRAIVVDPLSGPAAGGWIGVRRRGSGDRFAALPATPAPSGEVRARWSSDAFPPGEYEFRAFVHDAAGNAAVSSQRRGGGTMVLFNPPKEAANLEIGLTAPDRRLGGALRAGLPVRVGGRIVNAAGTPLSSMQVHVLERFGGGLPDRSSGVVTDEEGRFVLQLPPGPSREVTATFAGSARVAATAAAPMRLAVRSAVRLRASAHVARIGGAPIVFAGRVVAAPGTIPAEGKSVQLQFRLPGVPWTEFRTVQTDRRGRFRYPYRFSDDDSRGVRFSFRAFAPAQGGWPYEPAGSRPVAVRGR
ncbi:MAG TPA: carboxypeptidase-like regulatory domain-containing protein [Solirubrobacterales bacterium]|nr:carboxypeptidase-like regulatory domain-containing protein [Solirubrobacterales bacterium]